MRGMRLHGRDGIDAMKLEEFELDDELNNQLTDEELLAWSRRIV